MGWYSVPFWLYFIVNFAGKTTALWSNCIFILMQYISDNCTNVNAYVHGYVVVWFILHIYYKDYILVHICVALDFLVYI